MKRAQQIANATSQGTGANPIPTIGGEDFPQNTPITLNINGGLFTGSFVGNNFYVTSSDHPENDVGGPTGGQRFDRPLPAAAREGSGLRLQDGRTLRLW